jgi:transcriptional regulator with XRE-family HTH domain
MIRAAIGRRIKELRKRRALTQADVANATGMSTRTVSNIEGGRNGTPVETLYRISEKLGVELKDLFDGIGVRHRRSPRRIELETRLLDMARAMPDEHLEIAIVQVAALVRTCKH